MRQPLGRLDFSLLSFLLIDDQPYTRRIVRSMLIAFGSREIYESVDGAEALELIHAVKPNIVITDLVMPVVSGLRFVNTLKMGTTPAHNIPIIVLSGYLTRSATLAVRRSGADEFLVKPVSPKALYQRILHIVLRDRAGDDQTLQPIGRLQIQKRRAELRRSALNQRAYL
jgi:two-component system, chemotaxis family, chemotaxis protein CheY